MQLPDEREAAEPSRHRTVGSSLQGDSADDVRLQLAQPGSELADVSGDIHSSSRLFGADADLGSLEAPGALWQWDDLDSCASLLQRPDERSVLSQQDCRLDLVRRPDETEHLHLGARESRDVSQENDPQPS